jgi:hypothetical protein
MDDAMIFLLPVALAVGLWWLARVNNKRAAEQAGAVRRIYTEDQASTPWIPRKSDQDADVPTDADEPTDVLELEASGGFRVPKKP